MPLSDKTIVDPEEVDNFRLLQRQVSLTLNAVKIGQIQSFDGTKKTAQIALLFRRVLPSGTITDYPVLVDCPVVTLQGGGGSIQFPIVAGDQCLVFFADRNIDAWFKTGTANAPFNARAHDLSDGIALVGINSLVSSLDNYVAATSRWKYDGAEIDMSAGLITVKNGTASLLTIINSLFSAIEAIQVTGGLSLTAPSVSALEAVKAEFATLLSA